MRAAALALTAGAALGACGAGDPSAPPTRRPEAYQWRLPAGFPMPAVPADNPMTAEKVELGRHLFYDTGLSGNRTQSCASCHVQARAFADPRPVSVGSTGEPHPRNGMSLANVAYASALNWANPTIRRLEEQAAIPLFGQNPVEQGLGGYEEEMLDDLRANPRYRELFRAGFPGESAPVSVENVLRALAAFQRELVSGDSPYDRYKLGGDESAIPAAAVRGETLFSSERTGCVRCHAGVMFTTSVSYAGTAAGEPEFFNNGLYNVGGTGAYPADNTGLHELTGQAEDMGRFKAPTLRNVAVTAPYMHDGSIATLGEVLDHYARGGRVVSTGPLAGDGRLSPYKSGFVTGFALSAQEKADLLAFLHSLTDSTFLTDPRLSDPWRATGGR